MGGAPSPSQRRRRPRAARCGRSARPQQGTAHPESSPKCDQPRGGGDQPGGRGPPGGAGWRECHVFALSPSTMKERKNERAREEADDAHTHFVSAKLPSSAAAATCSIRSRARARDADACPSPAYRLACPGREPQSPRQRPHSLPPPLPHPCRRSSVAPSPPHPPSRPHPGRLADVDAGPDRGPGVWGAFVRRRRRRREDCPD